MDRARAGAGCRAGAKRQARRASDCAAVKGAKIMREQLQARLKVLKAELAAGQVKLGELELQQLRLRELLLRLRGAIGALEDLLGQAKPEMPAPPPGPPPAEHEPNAPVALEQGGGPP